ncbi:MAG: NADH-quinone oxidoreductase subunit J family protein [Candidatus Kariarchaeaceae archaeon]|jgi:NADH-quinone oxidoreductase subunit J
MFTQIIFISAAILVLFSLYMTWTVPKTMQAAYWLILLLVGISVLFLLANSEIMFAFQISIYGGGISVLLLFAALLAQHDDYLFVGDSFFGKLTGILPQLVAFLLLGLNMVVIPVAAVLGTDYSTSASQLGADRPLSQGFADTANFTAQLWGEYGLVIPFLSMLLLTALLGSVKLVIREWELEELSDMMKLRYQGNDMEVAQ